MKQIFSLATLTSVLFVCACQSSPAFADNSVLSETPIQFETENEDVVEALSGEFQVPENRTDPQSRSLTLHYVKFPSTSETPGSPIIYLAGGPGGSGIHTAKAKRFPLFMAMREFGDVIALDQRGTGKSNDLPYCESSQEIPTTKPLGDIEYLQLQKSALSECLEFWTEEGIDIKGYNTVENAKDLEALRKHLGAEKISLWGTSYGSHLSFAAMKQMPDRLDRLVLSSAEGLSQTVKLPARSDAYFDRLQSAINTSAEAKALYPDIKSLIGRVHSRLDAHPLNLTIPQESDEPETQVFSRLQLQQISSGIFGDPEGAAYMLGVYKALDEGNSNPLVELIQRWFRPGNNKVGFRPMSILTDVASGTDTQRRKQIEAQAETALMGIYLNHNPALEDISPELDLGDDFRTEPVSELPVLLLSGTLDGRTFIESQGEAVTGLKNVQKVTVRHAGHNLFMSSPEVTQTILDFMREENVDGRTIEIELPEFK